MCTVTTNALDLKIVLDENVMAIYHLDIFWTKVVD